MTDKTPEPPSSAKELLARYAKGERDFSRANLSDADLADADLSGAFLIRADLRRADLSGANLTDVYLTRADLINATLTNADLSWADLSEASLLGATLYSADLRGADLSDASLVGATLSSADLLSAELRNANLRGADLRGANLRGANLRDAGLIGTRLGGANLSSAWFGRTVVADVDLREIEGLDKVNHSLPSHISTDAVASSQGRIPNAFLRGCGLSEWEVQAAKLYDPGRSLDQVQEIHNEVFQLRADSPIKVDPIFISYSHADASFVERVERELGERHIRSWRDVHDLKAGRLESQLEHAIAGHSIFLLVLSKHSVESDWVEWEAAKAREVEKEAKRDVLCPVALDDAWTSCDWPGPLRRQIKKYHVIDFSDWQDGKAFKRKFRDKLLEGLRIHYRSDGDSVGP